MKSPRCERGTGFVDGRGEGAAVSSVAHGAAAATAWPGGHGGAALEERVCGAMTAKGVI